MQTIVIVTLVTAFLMVLGVILTLVILKHKNTLSCTEAFSQTTPASIAASLERTLAATKDTTTRVGLVTMARNPPDMDTWLNYHLGKGIHRFYVRLEIENETPEDRKTLALLRSYPQVFVQVGHPNETPDADDKHLPGQQQMLRQRQWLATAILQAQADGMDWLVHIDSDELVDVLNADSIGEAIVKDARRNTQTMVIPNYEVFYGKDKLQAPGNDDRCFKGVEARECAQGHCAAYANGKSVGRISKGLREWGAHRFIYQGADSNDVDDTVDPMQNLVIVHFESCRFQTYVEKYKVLARGETSEFPFPYYNDTIAVARSPVCTNTSNTSTVNQECDKAFQRVYAKYRMVS